MSRAAAGSPGDPDDVHGGGGGRERPAPLRASAPLPSVPGYRIDGILGSGASGVVYRARQLSVDRPVALKVLSAVGSQPDAAASAGTPSRAARRLQREARTAARLAHPNIITAIDAGEVDGTYWYAMALVEGGSLAERLGQGALGERAALKLFIPLCEALCHLAEHGVVHRDIKPGNILLDERGHALLVDLGLAFADDDPMLTQGGGTLGTPHYISPEQAQDPSRADHQSDLWSLGATLFHALCGRPPFKGRSVAEILSGVLYARVPDPRELCPGLSRGMALVVRKCLQRDRQRRYAHPSELLADLERLRERRAPSVARRGLEPVAGSRRALTRWAVGLGLAGLVAGGAVWRALAVAGRAPQGGRGELASQLAWQPLEELARRAASDPSQLAGVYEDLVALRAADAFPPHALPRYQEVYDEVYARLERTLWHLQREVEDELNATLRARALGTADELLATGLAERLASRTGYTPSTLPGRWRPAFDTWRRGLAGELNAARRTALEGFAHDLAGHWERVVATRVDALVGAGDLRAARELLSADARTWSEASGADARGLAPDVVARAVADIEALARARRVQLDAGWRAIDGQLLSWVRRRAAELEQALEERAVTHAADVLEQEWTRELGARGVDLERSPANVRLGLEAYESAVRRLEGRGRELRLEDARQGLSELDRELEPLFGARRYADAAALVEGRSDEPWLEPMRAALELRADEARQLAAVFERVALRLELKGGAPLALRVGPVVYEGTLELAGDPRESVFHLAVRTGRRLDFALRPDLAPAGAIVLGTAALEALADLPGTTSSAEADPRARLASALLRYHEGDVEGARRVLESGPLPVEDALAVDLARRVEESSSVASALAAERRERLRGKLNLLRRERLSGDRERVRQRVDELLREGAEVFTAEEVAELRRLRAELAGEHAAPEDLRAAFGPEVEVTFPSLGRARLAWRFQGPRAGAWSSGDWSADGRGWVPASVARSDAELVADDASPQLVLRAPLVLDDGVMTIELAIEEPDDQSPELLAVSAAGFHFVFATRPSGASTCTIDTGSLENAVRRARAADGRPFAGFERGRSHELVLRVNRARGWAAAEMDGRTIDERHVPSLARDGAASVVVHAWETLRLVSATIEAPRR